MNKAKRIFYKDNMQSHSRLAEHFGLDEDTLLKVDYDWRAKTLDIWGDNDEQNATCNFRVHASYYEAAENFVEKKIGNKKKLIAWLRKNMNDKKIMKIAPKLLEEDAQADYYKSIGRKKFDLDVLKRLFFKYPNRAWSLG